MKNIIKISICILIFCFIIGCNSQSLTNEQIIQIVKDFENNQNLANLTVRYDDEDNIYDVSNNTMTIIWNVSPILNKVINYYNSNELDYSTHLPEGGNFTKAQCKNIALNYLSNKNISLLQYDTNPEIKWNRSTAYKIDWGKRVNNVIMPNYVSVSVNSNTGHVGGFYISTDPEPVIINFPTITNKDIANIINNATSEKILGVGDRFYDVERNTILVTAATNEAIYVIDAYTHKIVDVGVTMDKENDTDREGDMDEESDTDREIIIDNIKIIKQIIVDNVKRVFIIKKAFRFLPDEELAKLNPTIKQIQTILVKSESKKDVKYFEIDCTKTPPVIQESIKLSSQKEPSGYNYSFAKEDKNIVYLNIKDKKIIFNNGSNFAFVNNKTNNMGGNFIIENNKIKIPLNFAKKIGLTK